MKGTLKAVTLAATLMTLGACSSMNQGPQVVQTYEEPKWVTKCKQDGNEGGFLFWGGTDMVYSCGHAKSPDRLLSFKSAKTIAYDGFAERINGYVNSETTIKASDANGESKTTTIKYVVDKTYIRNQSEDEQYSMIYGGDYHTFIRVKMKKSQFDALQSEAKLADRSEQ